MDDRQKKVLKDFEKARVDIEYIPGFKKSDLSNREFTLAVAKIQPLYCELFDEELFTRPYVKELIESISVAFSKMVMDGVYDNTGIKEYKVDWKQVEDIITDKTASRVAMMETVKKVKNSFKEKREK